ncbi:MAG: carbohydrate-binding family 9-like protein [Cyclobacteriaceae bacterium]
MIKVNLSGSVLLFVALLCIQCNNQKKGKAEMATDTHTNTYQVKKINGSQEIDADWDKPIWKETQSLQLKNYMGDKPDHFPETSAKVRYDEDHIYVIFQVHDRYIRAIAKETNGRVYQDSCVEFFFSPGEDVDRGYFNFEANCKGVFLFQYHPGSDGSKGSFTQEEYDQITISHSLERDVEVESSEPETWTLEYKIPYSILSNYIPVDKPKPGVIWRANFYKCADKTSHPHWLTWAPVDHPTPNFHLPEYFGQLTFE